jgi:hypothetical protein
MVVCHPRRARRPLATGDSCAYHCTSETMATKLEATTSAPSAASGIARDFIQHRCRRPSRPTVRCGHHGARTASPPPSARAHYGCRAGRGSRPPSSTSRSSATTQTPSSQSRSHRSCYRYRSETLALGQRKMEDCRWWRRLAAGGEWGREIGVVGSLRAAPMRGDWTNPWQIHERWVGLGWVCIHWWDGVVWV